MARMHNDQQRIGMVVLALGLAICSGCGPELTGKRLYMEAKEQLASIQDPAKASKELIAKPIQGFERVVQRAPGTVWAARADVTLGSLYASRGEYDRAQEAFARLTKDCGTYLDLCGTARLGIAKIYEAQNRWDQAIAMYDELAKQHPWAGPGLAAPLYVAGLYHDHGDEQAAKAAYERAAQFYVERVPQAPTAALKAQAQEYLISIYQRLHQWDKAIAALQELLQEPDGVDKPRVLMEIAAIYERDLKDASKAQDVYSEIVAKYPEDAMAEGARQRLEELKKAPPTPQADTSSQGSLKSRVPST